MCCHQLFALSEQQSLVKRGAGSHCCSKVTSRPARTHHLSQLMGHAHPVIWCTYSSQCIVNYVLCHTCFIWHKVTKCGFSPHRYVKRPAGGKRWMVEFLYRTPSHLSSWIYWVYLPESHSSDAQVEVNIKDLKESLARYPSIKGYAIDWNLGFQVKHSYTLFHNTGL